LFETTQTFSVNNSTIILRDEKKELLLVTSPNYQNILVSRHGVKFVDMDPAKRSGIKNIILHEVFKKDKTFFFIKAGDTEYQVDLKFTENPITTMKF
jgi:hypothetical protein